MGRTLKDVVHIHKQGARGRQTKDVWYGSLKGYAWQAQFFIDD